MLTVNLSPVRSNAEPLSAAWVDPILTVNDGEFDLSLLGDGDTAVHPVLGEVSRTGNDYVVTLTLPHGPRAPHRTRFPESIVMTANGEVPVPPWNEEVA